MEKPLRKGRILSFNKKWDKLHLELPFEQRPLFTTFRYPYWRESEVVQIYYKNRTPQREKLGMAQILKIEPREFDESMIKMGLSDFPLITDTEARDDGFRDFPDMVSYMEKTYGRLDFYPVMNKLTLKWLTPKYSPTPSRE